MNTFNKKEFQENPTKVYSTVRGSKFVVYGYKDSRNVGIRFTATRYTVYVSAADIRRGNIKDKTAPTVYGIGFLGIGKHVPSIKGKRTKAYAVWSHMLMRCYDYKTQERQPTYTDCSVCEEWHNFQNFAEWFEEESDYREGLHLDKDIKIKGNKVYSPEACIFVSSLENSVEAKAKHYKFVSPQKKIVDVYNLSEFCRDNNLNQKHMSSVNTGKRPHHRQWRKYLC